MNDAATRRSLRVVQQVEPHRVLVDGRWLLNFASNDYLGLSQHPKVKQAASQALQQWGTGSGSSALLSGYSSCHEQLAMELAAWKDANCQPSSGNECGEPRSENVATLLFPTGYAANVGLLTSVIEPEDHVFSDRKNHASIIDGLRLAQAMHRQVTVRHFRHRDYADLERLLRATPAGGRRWIVTDSVFSMDGTTVPAARVWQLAQQYSCGLIVDEAHATGVCGDTGSGLFKFDDSNQPETNGTGLIVVGTLSKALGAAGGFVCCNPELAQRLLQSARSMIYSTALPPATVAAASQALQLARDDD